MPGREMTNIRKEYGKSTQNEISTQRRPVADMYSRSMELQRNIGNHSLCDILDTGHLQAKLQIGSPGDRYEQEADRIADKVMRMPEPVVEVERSVENRDGKLTIVDDETYPDIQLTDDEFIEFRKAWGKGEDRGKDLFHKSSNEDQEKIP